MCRDYAHLAITLCRCMNIPARYCTGYLGDIGIPPVDAPMDFAGWFEAYLGGRWYTFDPRNNVPRIGRILIGQGRDAADVPIAHTFGPNTLVSFQGLDRRSRVPDKVAEAGGGLPSGQLAQHLDHALGGRLLSRSAALRVRSRAAPCRVSGRG